MGTQPQPQSNNVLDQLVKSAVEQLLPQLVQALTGALGNLISGLFHKKPKAPVLVSPADAPVVNVPTPIPAPTASTPEPGQAARKIASVRLRLQQAERPNMTTNERLQDPGNLYPDAQGMVDRGEAFNYGAAMWFDLTAFDENGDEWQGHSILAANLEYRTRHEIRKNGTMVAFIQGLGGTGEGRPNDWQQQNANEITWAQRSWKDSVGMDARVRMGQEGTFEVVGTFAGVTSNVLTVRVS